jgi:hypothetical protein
MIKLTNRLGIASNTKVANAYQQLANLLLALEKRNLPNNITDFIQQEVQLLNALADDSKGFARAIKSAEVKIVRFVEKQLKVVPQKYYRKLWLLLGMSSFGIPFGVVFGMSIGNLAMMSIGLPIGMGIGAAIGTALDNKALKEGRQLDIELKH